MTGRPDRKRFGSKAVWPKWRTAVPMELMEPQPARPLAQRPRPSGAGCRRPVIGVTGPDHGGMAAWLFTWLAVATAGGRAVWIRPSHPRGIGGLDGLVVGGGADVDPDLYGGRADEI